MRIDPKGQDYKNIYKLMVGAIVPRPIAFVSTVSAAGVLNVSPFSYFTACSSQPPSLLFVASNRSKEGAVKDTLSNIRETGEFVVNIVSEAIAAQMNSTAAEFPPDVNEFAVSGLTHVSSEWVRAPRVGESPVQMECKLRNLVTVGEGPGGGNIVIGEVVLFHVDESVMADPNKDIFTLDPSRLKAVGRMGGPTYVRTQDRFDMERPVYRPER